MDRIMRSNLKPTSRDTQVYMSPCGESAVTFRLDTFSDLTPTVNPAVFLNIQSVHARDTVYACVFAGRNVQSNHL